MIESNKPITCISLALKIFVSKVFAGFFSIKARTFSYAMSILLTYFERVQIQFYCFVPFRWIPNFPFYFVNFMIFYYILKYLLFNKFYFGSMYTEVILCLIKISMVTPLTTCYSQKLFLTFFSLKFSNFFKNFRYPRPWK